MLNRMVPKLYPQSIFLLDSFGTMSNRMVPKPVEYGLMAVHSLWYHVKQNGSKTGRCSATDPHTFGTMSNRMVPKHVGSSLCLLTSFGTMSNRMVPKHSRYKRYTLESFGTMSNRMVPKPRILLFNMIGID